MGKELDIDDVAAQSPKAAQELSELRSALAMQVTEVMIDRVMPPDDDGYYGCPLCDYTGHWNYTIESREQQREFVRNLLKRALNVGLGG